MQTEEHQFEGGLTVSVRWYNNSRYWQSIVFVLVLYNTQRHVSNPRDHCSWWTGLAKSTHQSVKVNYSYLNSSILKWQECSGWY